MNDFHKGDPETLVGQIVEARREDGTLHATGKAVSYEGHPSMLIEVGGDEVLRWPAHMVALADDPSKDPVGTLRREDHEPGFSIWLASLTRDGDRYWLCVYSTAPGNRCVALEDIGIVDTVVVGSLLDTPAAEVTVTGEDIDRRAEQDAEVPVGGEVERAQKQRQGSHRRTFPYEVREWMDEEARVECFSGCDADHVVHEGVAIGLTEAPTVRVQKDDGQIVSWVIGLTRRAQSDIDELPQWERELLEKEAAKSPEPRVFRSDGPEPPADVECLRFFGTPDRLNGLFLRRSVDLQLRWVWVADPLADVTAMIGDTNWPVPNTKGDFTEEVSS